MATEYRETDFRDGFRFGLGFTVAGCLVWIGFMIIVLLLLLVIT